MSGRETRRSGPVPRVLVAMPAWNEESSVALVIRETRSALPGVDILVIDDDSSDGTGAAAAGAGADVIRNVFNLGVGGAMRVGFRYATERGYDFLVQVDADGQHDPRAIPQLLERLEGGGGPQVVIGARFAGEGAFEVPRARRWAMRMLAAYLSRLTGTGLTDVTSGFRAYNRPAIELFARTYPAAYLSDTVESLVIASRSGVAISQVPVAMRARMAGTPSQSAWRAVVYLGRVTVMLLLELIRKRPRPEPGGHDPGGRKHSQYEEDQR